MVKVRKKLKIRCWTAICRSIAATAIANSAKLIAATAIAMFMKIAITIS